MNTTTEKRIDVYGHIYDVIQNKHQSMRTHATKA